MMAAKDERRSSFPSHAYDSIKVDGVGGGERPRGVITLPH